MGVPKYLPDGLDKKTYMQMTIAGKSAAPKWAEEDIFIV
jgi:hydrogenase small subunit